MAATQAALAGPWRPSHMARPLHWWDQQGLQGPTQVLQALLDEWAAAWGVTGDRTQLFCQPASAQSLMADRWQEFGTESGPQAWLWCPQHGDDQFAQALFPGPAKLGPFARAVASACRQDLVARISALIGLALGAERAVPLPAALARTNSGAVEAVLAAPPGLRLVLSADLAMPWRTKSARYTPVTREPLSAATTALAERLLSLQVELEGCELDVAALQGLQIGDVVRLNHGLDTPVAVRHAGESLCRAYLGCRDSRKAVELAGRLHPAVEEVLQ